MQPVSLDATIRCPRRDFPLALWEADVGVALVGFERELQSSSVEIRNHQLPGRAEAESLLVK